MIRLILLLLVSATCFAQVDNPANPGGSDTQIQYNQGGNFGAESIFNWDYTNNRLGVGVTAPTSFMECTGVAPADVATATGTSMSTTGGVSLTGSVGGNTTIATTGTGGTGGGVYLTGGVGGVANSATTSSTGGLGGQLNLSAGAGGIPTVNAAVTTGGRGGAATMNGGNGTAPTSGTVRVGGRGGAANITAGAGAAGTGAGGTGGQGGVVQVAGGGGGASAVSNGGSGGSVNYASGAGGSSSGSGTGGAAGSISFTTGTSGSSTSGTAGAAGNISFFGGNTGTGGNVNGGFLYLYPGAGTGSGTAGNTILNGNSSGSFRGKVGIGTLTPSAALHTLSTTEQGRIGYDASNYYSTTVGSTGTATFDAVGSASKFVYNDPVTISNSMGATTADGLMCENPTAATSGNQKVSPSITLRGRGWTGAASQTVDFIQSVLPTQGSPLSGIWRLMTSVNGATATELLSVDSRNGGAGVSLTTTAAQSNSSPGTTQLVTTNNTGTNTWWLNKFSGTSRSAIGYDSSGGVSTYQSGGNGDSVYSCNSGLTSCSLQSYNTATGFFHSGLGAFATSVNAGSASAGTSTLSNQGTLENEVAYITTTGTLSTSATNILCDASAASCTGTPSAACSSHGSEGACNANDYHGGCSWYAGSSCSVFNYESGMSTCATTSGCSVDTSSCNGAGDQYSCEAQDDSYGGSCAWNNNPIPCSTYDSDQTTCESYSSYCTWTAASYSDCSAFNGDQTTCESYSGQCTWSDPDCTGSYISSPSSCSGSIDNYTCDGTYNTGTCSGSYGAGCTGTSTCTGIDDSTSCGAETGCTWATALGLTLPASPPDGREYRIKNVASSGADCIIYPNTGHDIDGSSSLNLSAYLNSVLLVFKQQSESCSGFSEGACTPTGCSPTYSNCSYDTGSNLCTGNAVCPAHDGNQAACEAQSYYSGCSGSYYLFKRWFNMADNY